MAKKRTRISKDEPQEEEKNSYFVSEKENLMFCSTGCTLLDCVLGNGYPLGRMVNIIGDKSTSKTALATEALINFKLKYPEGIAAYRETEGAYDYDYAAEMGLSIDDTDFGDDENPIDTVEAFHDDMQKFLAEREKDKKPAIYVLDSFDALSDEAEMKRDISDGSYNMNKQKQIGIMFRKLVKKMDKSKVLLIIISQVRENIGVTFGEKYRRSGGKALDFYASQCIWLSHLGQLKRTIKKSERVYGISVRAKCKKNKVGFPFRECDFDFIFGYGVDDIAANINYLYEVGLLSDLGYSAKKKGDLRGIAEGIKELDHKEMKKVARKLASAVKEHWREVERNFLPTKRKY